MKATRRVHILRHVTGNLSCDGAGNRARTMHMYDPGSEGSFLLTHRASGIDYPRRG